MPVFVDKASRRSGDKPGNCDFLSDEMLGVVCPLNPCCCGDAHLDNQESRGAICASK